MTTIEGMLIEVNTNCIENLMRCRRKIKGRDFRNWSVRSLMIEAVYEFHCKYGGKKDGK